MAKMTGAEAIVGTLKKHGVDTVFGLPGIQLDNLFDALYGARQSVRTLHTRHEQGAAYMALGYAQTTGKVGVCIVVPGPGLLNATAALCTASGSNVPVLCMAGQIPSRQIGKGLGIPHEIIDQQRALERRGPLGGTRRPAGERPRRFWPRPSAACWPAAAARGVRNGARHHGEERRMSCCSIPKSMHERDADPARSRQPPASLRRPKPGDLRRQRRVRRRSGAAESRRDAGSAGGDEPHRLAARCPTAIALALGMLGGQEIWDDVDVALVVGTRFHAPALSWGREKEVRIIRIDVDPVQIRSRGRRRSALSAHARPALAALAKALPPRRRPRAREPPNWMPSGAAWPISSADWSRSNPFRG